jgi:hypothetical protein
MSLVYVLWVLESNGMQLNFCAPDKDSWGALISRALQETSVRVLCFDPLLESHNGRLRKLTPSTPNALSQAPSALKSPGSVFENWFRAFGARSELSFEYDLYSSSTSSSLRLRYQITHANLALWFPQLPALSVECKRLPIWIYRFFVKHPAMARTSNLK